jgi:hypothetical protein
MERKIMTKKTILICDDSEEIGIRLKQNLLGVKALKRHFEEPELASKIQLTDAIEALEIRLRQAQSNEIHDYPSDDAAKIIDNADVLVIDYALFELDGSVTGERISYLARCYSKCGIMIALNQYPPYIEEYFDLTLRGHLESYADINIPSNSLSNANLWSESWSGFRPWSWPIIPHAVDKYQNRVNELQEHLKDNILAFLGFSDVNALTIPRSVMEFISRKNANTTTFEEFVDSGGSGNGLRGRNEQPISDEAVARIAAARIGCWLEYDILPGQNILVDSPHLASRFPSLLGKKSISMKALNSTASFLEPGKIGMSMVTDQCRFTRTDWLSRPAWFWNDLKDNNNIDEVRNPFTAQRVASVFCEDISGFLPKESAREFVADIDSPYVRRYVKQIPGVQYTPLVRFSL